MGLLQRLLGSETSGGQRGSTADTVKARMAVDGIEDPALAAFLGGMMDRTGRGLSERQALRNPALFRGVNLIAGTIGQLPLNLWRKGADGAPELAKDHPVYKLLRMSPNPMRRQTPIEFKTFMQGRLLLKGDAFAYIVPGVRGPQALVQLNPDQVTVEEQSDLSLRYVWQPTNGQRRIFSQAEMFHLRAPWSSDGLRGDGLLKLASELLGRADAQSELSSRLLANGTHAGGKISVKKRLDEEGAARLKWQFEEMNSGPRNAGRWIVLEEDADAEPFQMNGRDAQAIEQMKLMVEEMARFLGVPRPLLMMDETSWGSGIEALGLFLVTYCLLTWFTVWEEAIARSLLTDAERDSHYAKFNEAALLRGSLKDQAEFLSKALGGPGQTGFMVPDEARDKMEMAPLPGGLGGRPGWLAGQENGDA